MKIKFNDKVHTAKISQRGMLVSEEDNTFLGFSEDKLREGCSVYEEPLEDAVFEEVMTMANTIVEIKAYLDSIGTSYVGVTAKAALLGLC